MPTTLESPLLNRKEAMAFLRLSAVTLRNMTAKGYIKRVTIGRSVYYHRDELERVTREGVAPAGRV
jgi:hypothetical protein